VSLLAPDYTFAHESVPVGHEGAVLFRAIFLANPAPTLLARTRDGVIVEVNEAWVALVGYSRQEVLGHTTLELGLWADEAQRAPFMQALQSSGRVSGLEVTLSLLDGSLCLVSIDAGLVQEQGDTYHWCFLRDITSERALEEGLRAGEKSLQNSNEVLNRQLKLYEMTEAVAKVGHWVVYPGESVVHLSPGYADIGRLGDVRQVPIGEHLHRVHPDDLATVKRALKHMDGEIVEHRWRQPTGAWIWLRMRMHRQIEHGVVKADFAIVQDITVERAAAQALADQLDATRASEARFRSLTELSSDWYWEQDENFRFVRLHGDPAASDQLGVNNLIGLTRWNSGVQGVSPQEWAAHREALQAHAVFRDFEMQRVGSDGGTMWISVSGAPVFDAQGRFAGYRGTGRDITARKQAEADIERLAFYDPLTGLPNRRLLLDRLGHAVVSAGRDNNHGALVFIDLDNFKVLNDTLGHHMGDVLLQQVASRLLDCVRGVDTVARLGGDEFVVMLENLAVNGPEATERADAVGKKILRSLNLPYELSGQIFHSSPSMGITLFHDQLQDVDELLQRADLAMYQAKSAGRNTLRFFDPDMQVALRARAVMEVELRLALQRQEFLLYYQPVVDVNRTILGVEALLRWRQPERGMVSPGEFIPVAEQAGLILPLGQWVLEAACAQLVCWNDSPHTRNLTMAVNVSARQFRHPDFTAQLLELLRVSGANPFRLKLELTESMLLSDIEEVIAKMSEIRAIGVNFSLDDFGTGYSSLSYLKRLPLDQLKIDKSFVQDVLNDPNDAAIARTILSLAQSLDLSVVAEGVETEGQRAFLVENGCQVFQGYLFGRPVPIAQLALPKD
jgi:diguanylate cyclase (GGDEF)-like protein/PAS domain S-box-containing protein